MITLGVIFFWDSTYKVAYSVLHRHGSSHGVFIPALSAYFIYLKKDRLKLLPVYIWLPGLIGMLFALSVPSMAPGVLEIQFAAFVLFTAMAVLTTMGQELFRALLFPILFSILMVPIPRDIYARLADMTRHITFEAALGVLSILNIPYYKEGWLIKLPNALLKVAISCSGIRYLISYFVFGIAYAYLYRKSVLGRSVLVLATIPISLAASSLRLTIIFLATYFISPRMAEYWPHVILSWCVFFTILFVLIFLDQHHLGKKSKTGNINSLCRMGID